MRSRAARFTLGAAAWLAIGGAAAVLAYSERRIANERAAAHTFDLRAREAGDALADLRASQQAYVATGQGVAYWVPRVASIADAISHTLTLLRASAASAVSRVSLEEAAASVTEFATVDKRARDYIKSGQPLMAGDMIFTEGNQMAAQAARYVESAPMQPSGPRSGATTAPAADPGRDSTICSVPLRYAAAAALSADRGTVGMRASA